MAGMQSQGAGVGSASAAKETVIRDTKIRFERRAETGRNALNEPVFDWSELGTIWAGVERRGAREEIANEREGTVTALRVVVLSTPFARSITVADRLVVVSTGEVFDITGTVPHARLDRFHVILAARVSG